MSLDVWLIAPPTPERPKKAVRRHLLSFHEIGQWMFLAPFWPPTSSSGLSVDLYDNAHFAGDDLSILRAALLPAKAAANSRPEEWQELVGRQLDPVERTIYASLRRKVVVATIDATLAGVSEAEARRGRIVFGGDSS